jgi:hypothetical protein
MLCGNAEQITGVRAVDLLEETILPGQHCPRLPDCGR